MINLPNAYQKLTDKDLIILTKKEDKFAQESLIGRYKKMVRAIARSYFILGADNDDIIQEGMIGLFKAVNDYDESRNVEFSAFAKICVTRQMLSAIKAANRQKHIPLNNYLSYDSNFDKGSNDKIIKLNSNAHNPEEIIINRESIANIENDIKNTLSKFENEVLSYYLLGNSYTEIATMISKDEKAVDNAIQRIRKKVYSLLD